MIKTILNLFRDLSLSNRNGKFLGDKSYAYDDVYFMSKFILEFSDNSNVFNKSREEKGYIEYIKDIFQLKGLASGAKNYMQETLNLLTFAGILQKIDNDKFKIKERKVLEFITERVENAYIFLYLLVYKTFENDNLLPLYKDFVVSSSKQEKKQILNGLLEEFKCKSASIGGRNFGENTNWSKQLVKYSIIVLGYANEGDYVARTLNLQETNGIIKKVDIRDISINVEGTRTNERSKKINDYIFSFDKGYVQESLKGFLLANLNLPKYVPTTVNHIAEDLASLKIDKLYHESDQKQYFSRYEQDQFLEKKVRLRNQNIQRSFREGLLQDNAHRCPICGYEFEEFLVASHIKPYAKCEDSYDAINKYNGLLLCPNHDKLFEGAKLMTIDATTGKIILSEKALKSKDYKDLQGKQVDKSLIECERRHYLKWHNEQFFSLNKR